MTDRVLPAWSDYQDEVAVFFRSMGLRADTNLPVKGMMAVDAERH
jgi:hypothetical protein